MKVGHQLANMQSLFSTQLWSMGPCESPSSVLGQRHGSSIYYKLFMAWKELYSGLFCTRWVEDCPLVEKNCFSNGWMYQNKNSKASLL